MKVKNGVPSVLTGYTGGKVQTMVGLTLWQSYPWQPNRPIAIIVPWAASGSTDQVTRVMATEIEKALGVSVVVFNQPGATGSIGTTNELATDKDGYTWAAGAIRDVGTHVVLGMLDTKVDDWHVYLAVSNTSIIGVNVNTPYQDFEGLLAVEQAEMIRAGRIRPLAVYSKLPLVLDGVGEIPSITNSIPGLSIPSNFFGIRVPRGVPMEVVETMNMVWENVMMNPEALRAYSADRGALFNPLYDGGKAVMSPEAAGIPRP